MSNSKRSIGITVLTSGGQEKCASVYEYFCTMAKEMRPLELEHIGVYSTQLDDEVEIIEEETLPGEFFDEGTMNKVRDAIRKTSLQPLDLEVDEIINALQNCGILFRERR